MRPTHGNAPVGDGVLDVPRRDSHTGLSASVGEGLAPPAVYVPRPIFAPPRRGRRPRRPACAIRTQADPSPVGEGLAPPADPAPVLWLRPRRGRRPRRPANPRHAHGVIVRFRLTVDPGSIFAVPGGASPSGRIGFRVNRYPFAIPTPGRRGRRPLQKIGCITRAARGRRPLQTRITGRRGRRPLQTSITGRRGRRPLQKIGCITRAVRDGVLDGPRRSSIHIKNVRRIRSLYEYAEHFCHSCSPMLPGGPRPSPAMQPGFSHFAAVPMLCFFLFILRSLPRRRAGSPRSASPAVTAPAPRRCA